MGSKSNQIAKITNTLKKHRTQKELSQEELAKRLGITRQTVWAMEKGDYNPSLELAFKIAREFNVKIEDVFSYELDEKSSQ